MAKGNRDYRDDHLDLKYDDILKLEEKFKKLSNTAEYEINDYLWSEAGEILQKEVYSKMPRSKYKHYSKKQPKTHAKDSESLEIVRYNLGVKVQTQIEPESRNFGYLIFPNEGRGIRQRKKGGQKFFEKSLESKSNQLVDGLSEHLDKKIEEELK